MGRASKTGRSTEYFASRNPDSTQKPIVDKPTPCTRSPHCSLVRLARDNDITARRRPKLGYCSVLQTHVLSKVNVRIKDIRLPTNRVVESRNCAFFRYCSNTIFSFAVLSRGLNRIVWGSERSEKLNGFRMMFFFYCSVDPSSRRKSPPVSKNRRSFWMQITPQLVLYVQSFSML